MALVGIVPKSPAEKVRVHVDYASQLEAGETVLTASSTGVKLSDQTSSTTDIVDGSASVSGAIVTQSFKAGLHLEHHMGRILAVTSLGQELQADVRIVVSELATLGL